MIESKVLNAGEEAGRNAEAARLQALVEGMRATPANLNAAHVRLERSRIAERCGEALVRDGNAPNIDCALDMVETVFQVLRRQYGVEIAKVVTALRGDPQPPDDAAAELMLQRLARGEIQSLEPEAHPASSLGKT